MREEFVGWVDDDGSIVLDHDQPIVRCRDCRRRHLFCWCEWSHKFIKNSGFCVWGERMEANTGEYIVNLDGKQSVALKLAFAEEMRGGDFISGEIVRCRDCKYYETGDSGKWCLKSITTISDPDGFCAWAERRES